MLLDSFSETVNKWCREFNGDVIVTYNELLPIQEVHTIDAETYRKGILTQKYIQDLGVRYTSAPFFLILYLTFRRVLSPPKII